MIYLVVGFAGDEPGAPAALATVDLALTVVLAAEFPNRFLASYDRAGYLRGHHGASIIGMRRSASRR